MAGRVLAGFSNTSQKYTIFRVSYESHILLYNQPMALIDHILLLARRKFKAR